LAALVEPARELDLHAIPARYPNGLPGGHPHQFYSPDMAERARQAAEAIVAAVRGYYEAQGEAAILAPEEP
jgi:HEPN domain-containing protein